jgi:quinol monooxygenase YgiN
MFCLVVRFTLLPDRVAGFDALLSTLIPQVRAQEPGTSMYISHRREGRPLERVLYESYLDRAAFDAHEQAPHTRVFLAERGQYLDGDPEVWWLTSD